MTVRELITRLVRETDLNDTITVFDMDGNEFVKTVLPYDSHFAEFRMILKLNHFRYITRFERLIPKTE